MGPKAYVLWLKDAMGKDEYVKKCKGIVLNFSADERLSYERIWELVTNSRRFHRDDNYEQFEYHDKNFRITRQGDIYSVPMTKKLRPTYFKGVLRGCRIVPFGYVHDDQ